jgi:hypothetical protein
MNILNELEKHYDSIVKKELQKMGATIIGDSVKVYRGGDVPVSVLKKLRYNDFLSTVKHGEDYYGNSGADNYGKNIIEIIIPIKDVKITNGEIQYVGQSKSLTTSNKYPMKIYKAYNDYYGSNYTSDEIDKQDNVKLVASMALSGGRDEFDELMKKHK